METLFGQNRTERLNGPAILSNGLNECLGSMQSASDPFFHLFEHDPGLCDIQGSGAPSSNTTRHRSASSTFMTMIYGLLECIKLIKLYQI